MMNIALTGTIGSGKSRVAALLASCLDADIVCTDLVCRQLLQPGAAAWRELREKWPESFFTNDGELDRVYLREAVFNDDIVRKELEEILHPLVRQVVEARFTQYRDRDQYLIVEVPLLFEVAWQEWFDHVVSVYAPVAVCIERTVRRDHVSQSQAARVLKVQMAPTVKAELADSVIDNSGLWVQTVMQVSYFASKLQHLGME